MLYLELLSVMVNTVKSIYLLYLRDCTKYIANIKVVFIEQCQTIKWMAGPINDIVQHNWLIFESKVS